MVARNTAIDRFDPEMRECGAAILCGPDCLEQVRAASITTLETTPIAEYLTQLVQTTGVEQVVAEGLDLAALGRFKRAVGS